MKYQEAKALLKKYKEDTLTADEKAQLEAWYLKFAKTKDSRLFSKKNMEADLNEIWMRLPVGREDTKDELSNNMIPKLWLMAVASLLLFVAFGIYFYVNKLNISQQENMLVQEDVLPGENRATLTLDNGEQIVLNDAKIGTLATDGITAITKTEEGRIAYHNQQRSNYRSDQKRTELLYNTLSTPQAGQYQVQLPDGTHVWLNALSSIRFPSVFSEKERVVEITGEVYFEVEKVTHETRHTPFRVIAGEQIIEVLGTRFNVNSYQDEEVVGTTLVEGSIKVKMKNDLKREVLLRPGQQMQIAQKTLQVASSSWSDPVIRNIDTDMVVSWKDGYFCFDNTSLEDLMRQISRWYGIEVVYKTSMKGHEFTGKIERSASLSKVLKILELGGLHFKLAGKQLIVM